MVLKTKLNAQHVQLDFIVKEVPFKHQTSAVRVITATQALTYQISLALNAHPATTANKVPNYQQRVQMVFTHQEAHPWKVTVLLVSQDSTVLDTCTLHR